MDINPNLPAFNAGATLSSLISLSVAFVLGTVIGLIQMLKGGVEDPNALTAGMAVALITTFYGSFIASLMVGPLCDKLATINGEEMAIKTIMLKGVMSIQAGDNPRIVEQKLKIFLAPSQRGFGKDAEEAA